MPWGHTTTDQAGRDAWEGCMGGVQAGRHGRGGEGRRELGGPRTRRPCFFFATTRPLTPPPPRAPLSRVVETHKRDSNNRKIVGLGGGEGRGGEGRGGGVGGEGRGGGVGGRDGV